jgi:SsrA-binding protein
MSAYVKNKTVFFNYELMEKYEGGIELLGTEVKAIRGGKASLKGAFIIIRGGEVFLINANIQPYQPQNIDKNYNPLRNRKILLTKKEIKKLVDADRNKGLTIVPISLYNKGNKIKIELAVMKGKRKHDKRETIKKRETDIIIQRELKKER